MNERQKIMNEVSKAQKQMTDLYDMLSEEGMPAAQRRVVMRKLNVLSDIVFYGQESLSDT